MLMAVLILILDIKIPNLKTMIFPHGAIIHEEEHDEHGDEG